MREKLKAWLWDLLGLDDILKAQQASEKASEAMSKVMQAYVDGFERQTKRREAMEKRIEALETAPSILPQLQADIRLVQEARREIEALRHEMAQRPGVIKTRTASEFRKQMEAINGQ